MITKALVSVFFSIVKTFMDIIPGFDISSIGGITAVLTSIQACSAFMPVAAFSAAIKIFLGFNVIKFAMSLINWIIRKIPTID